jgi:YD repeat-containing protein
MKTKTTFRPFMKQRFFLAVCIKAIILICLVFTSCHEQEIVPSVKTQQLITAASSAEFTKMSSVPMSSFTFNGRTYSFVYDEQGRVSSINVVQGTIQYQYVAHYEGDRLVSADLIENGQVMSSNTNFEYGKKGVILSYDYVSYFYPEFPEGIVQHQTLSYNSRGDIVRTQDNSELTYDGHRNVVQWGSTQFTYDKGLNPFSVFPDLWILFVEEPFLMEFTLSENNSTSRTNGGVIIDYVNEYNEQGQLISKTGYSNGQVNDTITFTY